MVAAPCLVHCVVEINLHSAHLNSDDILHFLRSRKFLISGVPLIFFITDGVSRSLVLMVSRFLFFFDLLSFSSGSLISQDFLQFIMIFSFF